MRPIRELPLVASLLLVALALFFGGGPADSSLMWLGGAALLTLVACAATVGVPGGLVSLVPLAGFAAWLALSITWSSLPAASWDYADRALVYLLFAAVGLWLAGRTRGLALGLAGLLGALIAWTLLGKVLPPVYDYGPPYVARLKGPVGLWNQLALVCAFALPLALWLKGRRGTLLAYGSLVALLLTYSRGGLATAVVVVAAWLLLEGDRIESGAVLVAAAVPTAVVVGIAFALPGVTSDLQSTSTRWHDGLIFGGLVVAGAVAAAVLARVRRPRDTPALRRTLVVLGAVALLAVVALVVVKAGSFGGGAVSNSAGRYGSGSSNFRTVWWQQAWDGWRGHELAGTGARTFHLTNLRYRDSYLDFTTEPHDLPLQFLTETGLVGLALLVLACAFLLRPGFRRRGHELALGLILPAFLLHSLVDVDWDFVAVSAPAFLVAGALAGRPALRRLPAPGLLAAAGVAVIAFGALLLPWLGNRWATDATGAPPAQAIRLADRADSVDPLLVDSSWARAYAAEERGQTRRAFAYYRQAVAREPKNPQTWLQAGEYALLNGCNRTAYTYLERYTELDPKARPSIGADDYRKALALVNAGKNVC